MAKKIAVYLKDSDIEVLWDISWAEIISLALKWARSKDVNEKLDSILDLLKKKPVVDVVDIRARFTPKQLELANKEIWSILADSTYNWFWTLNGDEWTYDFSKLCPWIQGSLREYIKAEVEDSIRNDDRYDFTMFKF